MSGAVAAAQAQGPAAGDAQGAGGMGSSIKSVLKMFAIMQVAQYGMKYFLSGNKLDAPQSTASPATADGTAAPAGASAVAARPGQMPPLLPLWPEGTIFDAHFAISDSPYIQIDFGNSAMPHVSYSGLRLGDWTWKEHWDTEIKLPESVLNNGTLYIETILARNGSPIDPRSKGFNAEDVHFTSRPLTQYHQQKRIRAVKNLISGEGQTPLVSEEEEAEKDRAMPIVSYYHPNITVNLVSNSGPTAQETIQAANAEFYRVLPAQADGANPRFYPVVFYNTFWQLRGSMYPVNSTTPTVPLQVTFEPIGVTKFQILSSVDMSFKNSANGAAGGASPADMDEIKRVFLETNPLLLVVTGVVSLLHTLFEFLAFKNDVSSFRNRKDQVGVSLRTIITNVFVQLIVLLYLLDQSTETSYMILGGQGIGLVIEAWKITKTVDVRVVQNPQGLLPYKVVFKDKHVLSKEEEDTKEYDALAFRYVAWGTAPLLVGYTIYSLLYESHRGWYSFVITTLTSFVYMFGFVQLIPQLIINWKLKSVAHLPMRSLTYKFLNTIVLYQYYIYPVDKTRANEYGQIAADKADKATPEKEQDKAKAVAAVKEESRKNR